MILFDELSANTLPILVLTTWPTEWAKSGRLSLRLVASGAIVGGTMLRNRRVTTDFPRARDTARWFTAGCGIWCADMDGGRAPLAWWCMLCEMCVVGDARVVTCIFWLPDVVRMVWLLRVLLRNC